jgi:hypothetical protein
LGVERNIGHFSPRTPDCRHHAQRFKLPGPSARKLAPALLFNKLARAVLKSYPKVSLGLQEGWTSNAPGRLRAPNWI